VDELQGKIMKTHYRLVGALIVLICLGFALSGCGTAYSAARDERTIGTVIDDKKLEGKIKYELVRDDTIKGLDISVYVFFGKAYLIGVIETGVQKSRAIAIAKAIKGVTSVSTYLLDKGASTVGKSVDDLAITAKVKARMIKDKEMKATQVNVKTVLGHVVLLGIVGNQKDANKAVRYAKSVENVRKVKSYIRVK
jgi:hyperosmotically inducible periplasmic protein